jgi:hypothetical protein
MNTVYSNNVTGSPSLLSVGSPSGQTMFMDLGTSTSSTAPAVATIAPMIVKADPIVKQIVVVIEGTTKLQPHFHELVNAYLIPLLGQQQRVKSN